MPDCGFGNEKTRSLLKGPSAGGRGPRGNPLFPGPRPLALRCHHIYLILRRLICPPWTAVA